MELKKRSIRMIEDQRKDQRARGILSLVAGTWTTRIYLGACFALLLWATVDAAFVEHQDASMAGVIPLLATAPASLFVLLLPENSVSLVLAVIVGALANAAVIGWCTRALRRRDNDSVRGH
jgi:hypothetical protein